MRSSNATLMVVDLQKGIVDLPSIIWFQRTQNVIRSTLTNIPQSGEFPHSEFPCNALSPHV